MEIILILLAVDWLFGGPVSGVLAGGAKGAAKAARDDFTKRRAAEQKKKRQRLLKTRSGRLRLLLGDTARAAVAGVVNGATEGVKSSRGGARRRRKRARTWIGSKARAARDRVNEWNAIEGDDLPEIAPVEPTIGSTPDPIEPAGDPASGSNPDSGLQPPPDPATEPTETPAPAPVCLTRGCRRVRADGSPRCEPCGNALSDGHPGDRPSPPEPGPAPAVSGTANDRLDQAARVWQLLRLGYSRPDAEAMARDEEMVTARVGGEAP
jgi:hypothetical protein